MSDKLNWINEEEFNVMFAKIMKDKYDIIPDENGCYHGIQLKPVV